MLLPYKVRILSFLMNDVTINLLTIIRGECESSMYNVYLLADEAWLEVSALMAIGSGRCGERVAWRGCKMTKTIHFQPRAKKARKCTYGIYSEGGSMADQNMQGERDQETRCLRCIH